MTRIQKKLESIARQHLNIPTLETRKSDSLDFHEVSVWSLLEALQAAYDAGRSDGAKAKPATDMKPDLPGALRENLSPHAAVLIAAKCQPCYGQGEVGRSAERESAWFIDQIIEMVGSDQYNRMCEELGV